MAAVEEFAGNYLKRPAPYSTEPCPKRPRPFFKEEALENQIFEWTSWDPTGEADMIFEGIKMKMKVAGLPGDDQIESVEWVASKSKIVFNFKDGSSRTFGLKISLMMY
jgi:hypothetical protein